MAHSTAVFWPTGAAATVLAKTAKLAANHIRLTVVLCVVLICGSFAAAAALQMRFDRVHALNQAAFFEAERARDIASVVAASLDRYEALGRAYADKEPMPPARGLRGIEVSAAGDAPARTRQVLTRNGLASILFAYRGRIVAVVFDAATLVPSAMMQRATLADANGIVLINGDGARSSEMAAVPGWPVTVSTAIDDEGALGAWYGSLPLYLFVILGPALAGGGLAAIFVREFERRARSAEAIRTLKSTRPADARLLIRLASAERQAVESHRSKAEFIAHMSHELRTPLNAIIGFSEVIERGFYGAVGHPKYVEYARDIGTAGRGLHAKIGDILEFANLEAGRYPLAPIECDLAEIAAECVGEHVGRAFSRRVTLEIAPSPPAETRADPLGVKRILTNLLTNALAFTPEGGTVRVEVETEEAAVVLSVHDNGNGFRPAEAALAGRAFRRFDRPSANTGAGMGLAIAMSLAHRMGGAVRLGAARGQGTRAELRLPKA